MNRPFGAVLRVAGFVVAATTAAFAEIPVREAFQLHCSGCHGPDGHGKAGFVPDLRELGPLLGVPGGREYLVRVPGVAQAPVDSAALARLLDFVVSEMAGVDDLEAFAPEEVEALRKRPLLDPVGSRPLPRQESPGTGPE